jgi:hypothetical protein
VGAPLEEGALRSRVDEAFGRLGLMVFGAGPEDFVAAVLKTVVETP